MDRLSQPAFAAYRGLVYETEGFNTYFRQSTVVSEIATLNIGSRPASRKTSDRIEDLRAIPVGLQLGSMPLMLPGWYGFGSAVTPGWRKPDGLAVLRRMFRAWPFFRTLMSNMDMVLAKSDLAIAPLRRTGPGRKPAHRRLRPHPRRMGNETRRHLLTIGQAGRFPLRRHPLLKRSIAQQLSLHGPSQPPAGRTAAPLPRGRTDDERVARASTSPSTASPPG